MTQVEKKLWSALRNKQLLGYKFRRQHGIGNYIVDFYSPELNLIIEVDGESHFTKNGLQHDKARDQYLKDLGLEILRFNINEIFNILDGVLFSLYESVKKIHNNMKE